MRQNQELLMGSLVRFYRDPKHISSILPIIRGNSPTPLRLFNWFVTNYAKENTVIIKKTVRHGESYLNVYISYRTQLKTYSKAQFDPFRRDEKRRIIFNYDPENPDKSLETTVGQLNFFKWTIETGIMDYILSNHESLEKEMRASSGGSANNPAADEETRETSSCDQPPPMKTYDYTTVVTFD
jgi:hypothetical protein